MSPPGTDARARKHEEIELEGGHDLLARTIAAVKEESV
jgi:hypothetical protein